MNKYFCSNCKQYKLSYLFFETEDLIKQEIFLREKNKAICYDCKLDLKLQKGSKIKPKK